MSLEETQEVINVKRALDDIQEEIKLITASMKPFYEKSDNPNSEHEDEVVGNEALFSKEDYNTFLTLVGRRRRLCNMYLSKMVETKRITQKEYDVYMEYARAEQEKLRKQLEKTIEMATKDLANMRETYKTNGMQLTQEILIRATYNVFQVKWS